MIAGKRIQSIEEMLTDRQRGAVERAAQGDYYDLLTCIRECNKALCKVESVTEPGLSAWRVGLTNHFRTIGRYLLSKLDDKKQQNLIARQMAYLTERNSNGDQLD